MGKTHKIKVPMTWKVILMICLIIIVSKIDPNQALELLREIIKVMSVN